MKKQLYAVTPEPSLLAELASTALRVCAGLSMAFGHGLGKLPPSENFVSGVAELGFPAPLVFAWLAALSEFGGGLLLALGLGTRISALFVAFTMGVAAFGRHAADPFKAKELALLYFVIAIFFCIRGASRISVDRFLR